MDLWRFVKSKNPFFHLDRIIKIHLADWPKSETIQNSSHVHKMQKGEKEQFASLQQGACSKFTGIIKSREVQLPFGIKPTQMLD